MSPFVSFNLLIVPEQQREPVDPPWRPGAGAKAGGKGATQGGRQQVEGEASGLWYVFRK